jgi:pimeloyl-ACP methyl ester carboxylesterase
VPGPVVVALHGIATTSAVWADVVRRLPEVEVLAPERPRTGELTAELAALAPLVEDRWVLGMSGGATLGLALAASDVRLAGAILHEPAVGSLLPGLLSPVRAAFEQGGRDSLGAVLYGPRWSPAMAGGVDEPTTARELSMFAAFEPAAAAPDQGPVVVTYGSESAPARREAAEALADRFGFRVAVVPGVGHFAAVEGPGALAALVRSVVGGRAVEPA